MGKAKKTRKTASRASIGTKPAGRTGMVKRTTRETDILLRLNLDGTGRYEIDTPVPFLSHMLAQLAVHGAMDLEVRASGDVEVDAHHTVEDVAICLGQAFREAAGDKAGIQRFGFFAAPLDEACCETVIDLSGRPHVVFNGDVPPGKIGNFDVEMVSHFFQSFANHALVTLHLTVRYGENRHHIVEALFKSFARALRVAVSPAVSGGKPASTKGVL